MRYVIADIIAHGTSVKEFHLRHPDGAPLPAWPAGAHIGLRFVGADGREYENRYSLVGAPGPAAVYRIAVQREESGRGGSRALHDDLVVGSGIDVEGPFPDFPLRPAPSATDARVLLIGGGIGITPMISMAHALQTQGRKFVLHYLARSRDHLALMDDLRALPEGALAVHLSAQSGRADLAQLLGEYRSGDAVYACGPAALLQALAETGARLGWPSNAIHVESFGPRVHDGDAPLMVELSLSQMTVEVAPGTSILDALIAADVFVSYECKRGECGSCYAQVVEGEPLHRDVCLTPGMRAQGLCTCVSWAAQERLVLAL
ncbi:MAG: Carnitine monooxygenase reductase subunit [Herbaspirillum frisingense]|uniref:Carnitine monooxygenase reductase subunit n=1 Tax=Herbaspirillum frisingense TaxID=92645 RepID=A0A7V8JTA3_9BURK|nr:MAG: Carnitine monooxygenase reductase subunit [Herbaspirillum frisingense]